MGWTTIENGALLELASAHFDVCVTVDRNLAFQQNLGSFIIAVIVVQAKTAGGFKALSAKVAGCDRVGSAWQPLFRRLRLSRANFRERTNAYRASRRWLWLPREGRGRVRR